MNKLLNFSSILGVFSLCFRWYMDGRLTTPQAFFVLVLVVILAASDKLIWKFFKALISVGSIVLLLEGYAYSRADVFSLMMPVLTLLIALFGLYIIFRGFFGNKNEDEVRYTFNKKTGRMKRED